MKGLKVVKPPTDVHSARLHVFIHEKHDEQIEAMMRRRPGVTKKDIVYSALENFFNPNKADNENESIILELAKLKRAQQRLQFNLSTLLDTFAVFVKIWMCHTQEIPKEHEAAAAASMNRRFKRFTELVIEEIKNGSNPFLAFELSSNNSPPEESD